MKQVRFTTAARVSGALALVALLGAVHETKATPPEGPYQRYITFYNELDVPIYPVIQAPNDSNCTPKDPGKFPKGSLLRILGNDGADAVPSGATDGKRRGVGIAKKSSLKVYIPMDGPCAGGGFYDATRIFIFTANVDTFEERLGGGFVTAPIAGVNGNLQSCDFCKVGQATLDYGHDAPAQLLEMTIISQVGAAKSPIDQNDPKGIPVIDFDVSYVDDVYLPVAMALDDTGLTQFMGSRLKLIDTSDSTKSFSVRVSKFLEDAKWSRYAAYSPLNWNNSETAGSPVRKPNKTIFADLVPFGRIEKIPSGNILVTNARTLGVSGFYQPTWDGKDVPPPTTPYPQTASATINRRCYLLNKENEAKGLIPLPPSFHWCPQDTIDNTMLGCCDHDKFLVDNTLRKWVGDVSRDEIQAKEEQKKNGGPLPPFGAWSPSNTTWDALVDKWDKWQGSGNNPCLEDAVVKASPAVAADQKYFCDAFNRTVDFLWKDFLSYTPECAKRSGRDRETCLVQRIIGYDADSGYKPENCTGCPKPDLKKGQKCEPSCYSEVQRNEAAQALLRGVPWTGYSDPTTCKSCPGAACPVECVYAGAAPKPDLSKGTRVYNTDGFLHFWPAYDSVYNLNPYARFVHDPAGADAPGAYSFSIDDFYGNFGGQATGLIIDVGGTTFVPDKEPFDPYKQYHVAWGPGWDHAKVCHGADDAADPGRVIANAGENRSIAIAFFKNGAPIPSCKVKLFATPGDENFVTYEVTEKTFEVTDSYTAAKHTVRGLQGVWASRPGSRPQRNDGTRDDRNPYCLAGTRGKDKTGRDLKIDMCFGNLAPAGGADDLPVNTSFVSVENHCTGVDPELDAACGKPLITLNIPGFVIAGTAQDESGGDVDNVADGKAQARIHAPAAE